MHESNASSRDRDSTGRIFHSPILEAFTRTSPLITVITYVPVIILLLWIGNRYSGAGILLTGTIWAIGLLSWTLWEYILHRYLFHLDGSRFARRLSYMLHGIHHEHPKDPSRLFMPPLPGLIIISVMLTAFYILLDKHAFVFMAGIVCGYLVYSFMHYSMHRFHPPKIFKRLWKHHALHHYKYADKAFGVSTLFWDRIFGTLPRKNEK